MTAPLSPVRGGGASGPRGFLFELTGGALCLDFANTVDHRPAPEPRELLPTYADLLSWARQAGAIRAEEARHLEREAAGRRAEADAALEHARTLREALFALFSAAAEGRLASPPAALEALNSALPAALGRRRLAVSGGRAGWAWVEDPRALDRPLWPVVESAAELLVSEELPRVRECAAETCAWLFLDRSRNRSRRWCDMTVCGNRDKVRRHRRRMRRGVRGGRRRTEPGSVKT